MTVSPRVPRVALLLCVGLKCIQRGTFSCAFCQAELRAEFPAAKALHSPQTKAVETRSVWGFLQSKPRQDLSTGSPPGRCSREAGPGSRRGSGRGKEGRWAVLGVGVAAAAPRASSFWNGFWEPCSRPLEHCSQQACHLRLLAGVVNSPALPGPTLAEWGCDLRAQARNYTRTGQLVSMQGSPF